MSRESVDARPAAALLAEAQAGLPTVVDATAHAPTSPQAVVVLLAKYNEHRVQARQHETLRGTMTNFMLAIAGGILALAGGNNSPEFQLAGAVLLVLLGSFGAALSAKHYERFRYHSSLATAYDAKLRTLVKESDLTDFSEIKETHRGRFPFSGRLRANHLWTALLLFVAVLGIALTLLTLPRYCGAAQPASSPIGAAVCRT